MCTYDGYRYMYLPALSLQRILSLHLLVAFANSWDPDQVRHDVGPDLVPNCLTLWYFERHFKEENSEKISIYVKKDIHSYPTCRKVNNCYYIHGVLFSI